MSTTPDPAPSPSGADPAAPAPTVDPAAPIAAAPPVDPAKPPVADPAKPAVAAPVVPEKYDFAAVKMPDGVVLDTALVDAISPVFKELGVTQEGATKLVEAHVKHLAQEEAKRDGDFKEWMKTNVQNYQTTIKKEWGAQFDANLVTAQRGMARVFSAEAKKLLDDTGLGNHPEFLKAFYQVGKMVTEDTPPSGQKPAGTKSNAEVFYGASATQ